MMLQRITVFLFLAMVPMVAFGAKSANELFVQKAKQVHAWEDYKKNNPGAAYGELLYSVVLGEHIQVKDGKLISDFAAVPKEVVAQCFEMHQQVCQEAYGQIDRAMWAEQILNKKDLDLAKQEHYLEEACSLNLLFEVADAVGKSLTDAEKLLHEKLKKVVYEQSLQALAKTFNCQDRTTLLSQIFATGKEEQQAYKEAQLAYDVCKYAHVVGKPLNDAELKISENINGFVRKSNFKIVRAQFGNNAKLPYLKNLLKTRN